MSKKVAVVTGSNKDIGYGIVKGLCEEFDGDIYLTARDEGRGRATIKNLNDLGFKPKFYLLDITVPESVQKLRDHLLKQYGGLNILVNNAAIAFQIGATEQFAVKARETTRVNYFAFRDTCNILFPILKPHARVVNVSSSHGHLSLIPGKHLRDILASPDLTEKKLSELIYSYVRAAENGTYVQEGWPKNNPYAVSKVALSALSQIQQMDFLKDEGNRPDIVVNSVHPGNVCTDLNRIHGRLTIEEGAEAPVYLALLPKNCTKPKGDYVWCTKEILDWVNGPVPVDF